MHPPAVLATCRELGLDPDADTDLVWIARDMAQDTHLPPGWSMYLHADSGRHFYSKAGTGKSVWEHPNLGFYKMAIYMERSGWELVKRELAASPPTDEELSAMYEYFDLDPSEDPYILEVAKFARAAPLPPGWDEKEDAEGDPLFVNDEAALEQSQHPLDAFFEELIRRRRREFSQGAAPFSRKAFEKGDVGGGKMANGVTRIAEDDARSVPGDASPGRGREQAEGRDVRGEGSGSTADAPAWGRKAVLRGSHAAERDVGRGVDFERVEREDDRWGERGRDVAMSMGRGSVGESLRQSAGRGLGEDDAMVQERRDEPATPSRGQERIRVIVRARPLEMRGRKRAKEAWSCDPDGRRVELKTETDLKHDTAFYGAQNKSKTVSFEFDDVYTGDHNTHHIYNRSLKPIVEGAFEGINGTIFAYGQTGSGKTYTIVGTAAAPGVVPIAAADMFDVLRDRERRYGSRHVVRVGIVELYNEELKDLLSVRSTAPLRITEDPVTGTRIQGLHEEVVGDAGRLQSLLARGESCRVVGRTRMNDHSSRSHVIVRVTVETHDPGAPLKVGTLNFVDLAGSERLAKSGSEGDRAKESSQINLSLLMLGNVISKLSEGKAGEFVPFRNSKLTRILQPAIGGNARTAIVACVSVATDQAEETSHTLRFAARAANITNTLTVNTVVGDAEEARRYKREIIELSREIQRLRGSDAALENDRLRTRVRELEHDNEVLRVAMERFKAAARGRGSADDMDAEELPSTPDGTELPAIAVRAGKITAKDAIAQVSRIVQLGKVGGNVYASEMPPAEVVQWVRVMRGERDSLRARVAALEGSVGRDDKKLLEAAEAKRQMGVVEESLGILENLVGGRNPEAQGIGERMQDVAEAAVVLTSELGSLQRQHAAALAVMAEVEERNRTLLQELQEIQAAEDEAVGVSRALAVTRERLAEAVRVRDDLARRAGIDPAGLMPRADALPPAGEASLKYAQALEEKFRGMQKRMKAEIEARTTEVTSLREKLQQYVGLSDSAEDAMAADGQPMAALFGSAAVRAAREAEIRAHRLEEELSELRKVNGEMRERLGAVNGEIARVTAAREAPSTEGEGEGEGEAVVKLKQRVYQLSKEVAVLLRERDDLMAMMGAGPAGPGGLSAMGLGAHAAPPAMTGKSSQARGRGPTGAAKSGKGRPRAEKAGPKDAWSNPTGQDYSVVDELKNMKKRLVQAERAHKELLARNQAEVRAARLQAQQAERKQTDLEGLVQQLVAENEQLRTGFAG